MQTKSANLLEQLRSSYWFVPSLMALLAILLSFGTIALDEALQREIIEEFGLIWAGGPEGARGLLSTVASSMLGVAGVTFSITIATLSLASSQFGPHLIRKFMRDRSNQVVLGTFVAAFLYCLLVLRTVRTGDETRFVPFISVTIALLLALAGTGVLIYFIHHVALSIQAPQIIAAINRDLENAIEQLFPDKHKAARATPQSEQQHPEQDIPEHFDYNSYSIEAHENGYIQVIDYPSLMKHATECDLVLRIESSPGNFVVQGTPLMTAWPRGNIDEKLQDKMNDAVMLARQSNLTQDVKFAITQMAEVAVRSLSPGINDPFTAIICVDWLSAALSRIAEREAPSPYHYDDDGQLRLITQVVTFAELLDTAFGSIRSSALSLTNAMVIVRMLEVIQVVAGRIHREEQYATLLRHTRLIGQGIRQQLSNMADQETLLEYYDKTMQVLEQRQEELYGSGAMSSPEHTEADHPPEPEARYRYSETAHRSS
jgi:uncharacterized membrane protein